MEATRLALTLLATFCLPGWTLLLVSDGWRNWPALQRWCLAVTLSVAFWPVLFYWLRWLTPGLALDQRSLTLLLFGMLAFVTARLPKPAGSIFAFQRLEWLAVAVFGLTIATRLLLVRDHPYPAWSDSLHHAILTQLTAETGRLPSTMQPYFPISLRLYHLGLYGLTATVQSLSNRPAHEALLYTAQILSGLCGLGIYLTLDRLGSRWAAIWGAAVVGLLSHLPSYFANWGRFTQLAAQTILLAGWLVSWYVLWLWCEGRVSRRARWWWILLAGLLNGAVFLCHFRVAAFALPWLAIGAAWFLPRATKRRRLKSLVSACLALTVVSLLVAAPALAGALPTYVGRRLAAHGAQATQEQALTQRQYHDFPLSSITNLVARPGLLVVAALSAALGVWRRNRLVLAALAWILLLVGIGLASRLSVPLLGFTNLGAVFLVLYLPLALVSGVAAGELANVVARLGRPWPGRLLFALAVLACLLGARARASEIEGYRHFLTPADVAAMDWIKRHTPAGAVFAINTTFWLPRAPHGTDGGYWIPYFTLRQTTAGAMLHSEGEPQFEERVVAMSRAVVRLAAGEDTLAELRRLGVSHIYVGPKGNFAGTALNAAQLAQLPGLHKVYQAAGVTIFAIGRTAQGRDRLDQASTLAHAAYSPAEVTRPVSWIPTSAAPPWAAFQAADCCSN